MTGHSLGAGASVLVALYLRNYFKGVFCWAFSPPGGLAEPSVADAAQSFCTSVALGKDWIPRLTLASFEHLRDEMVRARNPEGNPMIACNTSICICKFVNHTHIYPYVSEHK